MSDTLANRQRLRPKSYNVAVWLVIAAVVMQVVAIFSIFLFRRIAIPVNTNAPALIQPNLAVIEPKPVERPAMPNTAPPAVPDPRNRPDYPSGVIKNVQELKTKIVQLNDEGAKLRRAKNFEKAAKALEEAERLNANEPNTLSNLALLYEDKGDKNKARQYWQRIVDLGASSAGSAYKLAVDRLQLLPPAATEPVAAVNLNPGNDPSATSPGDTGSPAPAAPARALPKRLFIEGLNRLVEAGKDPNLEFTLAAIIARSPTEPPIDPNRLGLQLFFYDRTSNGSLDVSKSPLTVSWASGSPSWNSGRETLRARFRLPASLGRTYYGFVLRIGYEGVLQDERIEPPALRPLLPPDLPAPGR